MARVEALAKPCSPNISITASRMRLLTSSPRASTAAAAEEPSKPAMSSAAAKWTPPKTPWGDPDLQGTWPLDQLGRTPLQRPAQYGDRLNQTDEEYKKAHAAAQE